MAAQNNPTKGETAHQTNTNQVKRSPLDSSSADPSHPSRDVFIKYRPMTAEEMRLFEMREYR